jgi:flavin-binding protein dodecin
MQDHVYKLIELTGTSTTSIESAVNVALHRASLSVRNLRWFQITEIRGDVSADKVAHWQVTLKAGFTVED